ncbi:MFS transporter [Bacillus thuringiensis]|uniref:MFS transporter n=1 Tax=Bacillus thuringiensis TaxID=1428 RepID=UPI0015E10E9B|nr:MFS transporter [Bacillus thuringiensis]
MKKIAHLSIFRSLQHKNFFLLWLGLFISNIGTWSQVFIQQWYIFTINHSAFDVGLLATIQLVPNVLFMLIGGTLADRINRKKLLLFTQTAMAVLTIIIASLISIDKMNITTLLCLNFIYGILVALDIPARRSLVPNLVPKDDIANANALYASTFQIALFLGPLMGSLITSVFDFKITFWFNAFSFIGIILAVWKMELSEEGKKINIGNTFRKDMLESYKIIANNKILLVTLLSGLGVALASKIDYLLPTYVEAFLHKNTEMIGILNAAIGIGLFVSAIMFGNIDKFIMQYAQLFLCASLFITAFLTLLLTTINIGFIITIIFFLRAMSLQIASMIIISLLQFNTQNEYIGRIMGVYSSFIALSGLSALPISYLVYKFSISYAFICLTIIAFIIGLLLINKKLDFKEIKNKTNISS